MATPQAQQASPAFAGVVAADRRPRPLADADRVDLLVGRSTILNIGSTIARVSLTVPDVADAMVTAPQELLIHGKTPGTISLFVWDRAGGDQDLRGQRPPRPERARRADDAAVPRRGDHRAAAARTSSSPAPCPSKYVIDKAAEVAAGFVEKKENVVNLLKQQEGVASNQVMLRVRFAEVSRSALQELGASLFTGHRLQGRGRAQLDAAVRAPDFTELSRSSDLDGDLTAASGKYSQRLPEPVPVQHQAQLGAVIKALQTKGLFQSLAEPNLIATNGKEASFLAGGEYPYPVVQGGGAGNAVTIMFKEFGVRLSFTPTVLGGDLINLKVRPEVSSLDFANAVSRVRLPHPGAPRRGAPKPKSSCGRPDVRDRRPDEQHRAATDAKIPGIGDIPILGQLFRSRAYPEGPDRAGRDDHAADRPPRPDRRVGRAAVAGRAVPGRADEDAPGSRRLRGLAPLSGDAAGAARHGCREQTIAPCGTGVTVIRNHRSVSGPWHGYSKSKRSTVRCSTPVMPSTTSRAVLVGLAPAHAVM